MYKTVFILGAGASADAGVPVMANFLERAENLKNGGTLSPRDQQAFDAVFDAIYELQGVNYKSFINLQNIEELFGTAEMSRLISKLGSYDQEQVEFFYESMKRLILVTIDKSGILKHNGSHYKVEGSYHKFAELINNKDLESRTTIITFNYDVLLDYALQFDTINFNYCLKDKPPAGSLPLLKVHGSLNWGTCEQCGGRIFHWPIKKFLDSQRRPDFRKAPLAIDVGGFLCKYEHQHGHRLDGPVLVPPTWAKSDFYHSLKNVWVKAAKALEEAEAIYIIGFSLQPTDMFFRYLFAVGTHSKSNIKRIWIFDPYPRSGTHKRFGEIIGAGLTNALSYFELPFSMAIKHIAESSP